MQPHDFTRPRVGFNPRSMAPVPRHIPPNWGANNHLMRCRPPNSWAPPIPDLSAPPPRLNIPPPPGFPLYHQQRMENPRPPISAGGPPPRRNQPNPKMALPSAAWSGQPPWTQRADKFEAPSVGQSRDPHERGERSRLTDRHSGSRTHERSRSPYSSDQNRRETYREENQNQIRGSRGHSSRERESTSHRRDHKHRDHEMRSRDRNSRSHDSYRTQSHDRHRNHSHSRDRGDFRERSSDRHRPRSPSRHSKRPHDFRDDRSASRQRDTPQRRYRERSPSCHRDRSGSNQRERSEVRSTGRSTSRLDSPLPGTSEQRPAAEAEQQVDEEMKKETEEPPIPAWTRCCPADIYFKRDTSTTNMVATAHMQALESRMEGELAERAGRVRESRPPVPHTAAHRLPLNIIHYHLHKGGCCGGGHSSHSSDNSSDSDSSDSENEEYSEEVHKSWMEAINRKKLHPERLHDDLWFNEPDEMNDGPICRCSKKNRKTGIRHYIYPGEKPYERCNPASNNADKLFHYQITMSPHTNFLTKNPTVIAHDDHEYIFEGFSLFSHHKIEKVPVCKVIRFNIEYTIHWLETDMPQNVSVTSMDLFARFLYTEILELVDLDWISPEEGCPRYHIMPRFARGLPNNGKELLSMNEVLRYLLSSSEPLIAPSQLPSLMQADQKDWQRFVDKVRGAIVTYPGKRPSSIRIDQLDRENIPEGTFPKIVHFGIKPAQLSYAGDPAYQRLWKQYMKLKHLLANKPKVTSSDRSKLKAHEDKLQDLRLKDSMKREMTVEIDSEGFIRTGIHSDMTQHGLLVPVLVSHLRFHQCLFELEKHLNYTFTDRTLLQLALTHPSYRIKFGTNPDHARNSLTNCGMRQLEYGDRRIHYKHTRKRGINTLFYIMSKLGRGKESLSEISHYERLEFLGDAIVEFLSSIHLFYMFPSLEEGGLTMYRTALVQNQHLTVLAGKLKLQHFMLYAHGPDLCRDSDLRHAMANCFEALIGALYLDGGISVADRVLSEALFGDDQKLFHIWSNYPKHPLQMDEPNGDRHWIASSAPLKKLVEFEESIGVEFSHIRLLAKAFSMRNVGYNNLTMGHNQRLEFLGDTVLQLITSDYLFKHFPDHHEGHLSLLRSSLVNNRTQAVVCTDLDMLTYVINADKSRKPQADLENKFKYKDRADLVEALLGALYVDKGLECCKVFCQVCFYPRLKEFIMNQDWNDPKSQLQQCCLTLRGLDEADPNIPLYKTLESTGPTNTRKYVVAVYFKGRRLATGTGHSIQEAQMLAASNALKNKATLFPLVKQQKHFLSRKFNKRRHEDGQSRGYDDDDSLPAGYRMNNNWELEEGSDTDSRRKTSRRHASSSQRYTPSKPDDTSLSHNTDDLQNINSQ